MRTWVRVSWLIGAVGLLGCDRESALTAAPAASSSPTAAASASASGVPAAKGPAKPSETERARDEPGVVAAAAAAAKCEWKQPKGKNEVTSSLTARPDIRCPAIQKWAQLMKTEVNRGGTGDATLLRLLESEDDTHRWLAARGLYRNGGWWETDPEAAGRVLAVARAEANEHVAYVAGRLVASIKPEAGVAKKVIELISEASSVKHVAVRRGIANAIMPIHIPNDAYYAPLVAVANDKAEDALLRRNAIDAVRYGDHPGVCSVWAQLMGDPEPRVALESISRVAGEETCSAQWDTMIEATQKLEKDGKLVRNYNVAFRGFSRHEAASESQKKAVAALAKAADEKDWL